MQLPGQTRLSVQSLGRQDSRLEMSKAQSKVNLTNAITNTVAGVNDAVQREVVEPAYQREAVAQYAKAESDRATILTAAEAKINNPTGMVPIEKVPTWVDYREFDKDESGEPVRRTHIPTYEIADEWYRGEMKRSQEKVMFEMTNAQAMRKLKADYGSAYLNNYAGVLLQAQKRKLEAERADMEVAVERFVEGGDQSKAETLVLGAMETGVIGPKEGTEKLMAIPGDIDAYETSRRIHTSGLTDMDYIIDHIYRDYNVEPRADGLGLQIVLNEDGSRQQNPMSFAQRKTLVKEVETRRRSLENSAKTNKDDTSARTLNDLLIDLQDMDEPMTADEMATVAPHMTASDHKTLIVANRALHSSSVGTSDAATLSGIQMAINDLQVPSPKFTVNQRRAAIINQINDAMEADELTGDDAWKLIQRINTTEERAFDTPDMELATDQIYKRLTRGSKSSIGLNVDSQSVINAADAERALFEAARAAGPEFNAMHWLDANLGKYVTRNAQRNTKKLTKSLAKPYIVVTDFEFDHAATNAKLKNAMAAGTIQYDTQLEVLRLIDVQLQFQKDIEEARKREEDQKWSWPWN